MEKLQELISKIESQNYSCIAGKLILDRNWIKLKKAISDGEKERKSEISEYMLPVPFDYLPLSDEPFPTEMKYKVDNGDDDQK